VCVCVCVCVRACVSGVRLGGGAAKHIADADSPHLQQPHGAIFMAMDRELLIYSEAMIAIITATSHGFFG